MKLKQTILYYNKLCVYDIIITNSENNSCKHLFFSIFIGMTPHR